jgi:hypothetical protein
MKTQPYHIVRTSKIHGRGVFARRPIRKGIRVIEYTGPIVSAKEAEKIGSEIVDGHGHTMLFQLDHKRVINGNAGGDARYINHGCDPNCETEQDGDHIYIVALRSIKKGEELVYDYHLQVEGKITESERKAYACFCGSPKCRGSQIAADLLEKQAKKDGKKKKKQEDKKKKKLEKIKLDLLKKAGKKKKKDAKKDKKSDSASDQKKKKDTKAAKNQKPVDVSKQKAESKRKKEKQENKKKK